MRVTLFTPGAEGLGPFHRCFYLGKYLSHRGHEVCIICASPKPTVKFATAKIVEGVKIINLLKTPLQFDKPGYVIRTLISPFFSCLDNYDVIHLFAVQLPPTAAATLTARLLKNLRLKNASIIVDWEDWWGRGGLATVHGRVVHGAMTLLEEKVPLLADATTVVSELLKRRALGVGVDPQKLYEVPNGADVDFIRPMSQREACLRLGFDESEHILVYVGHYHGKCLFTMIDALKNVVRVRRDVHVVFVGSIPREYKKIVLEDGDLKNHITLAGKQPYENIPLYLAASNVLLLPLEDNIFERARWPIRLGDYLAAGRPIVASAVGEAGNVVEREGCGVVARPDDPRDFADKILMLLENDGLSEELGRRGRRAAEETYAWPKIALTMEQIYKDVKK